jgi:hypothetical protein
MIRISSEYDWFDPKQIAILLDFAGVIPPGSSKKYY